MTQYGKSVDAKSVDTNSAKLKKVCQLFFLFSTHTVRRIVTQYCKSVDEGTERIFDTRAQQDACFFLLSLLDCMRAELKDDAILLESFIQGELKLCFTCLNCYDQCERRNTLEPVTSLPIKSPTIPESIVDFYKTEVIEMACKKCGH